MLNRTGILVGAPQSGFRGAAALALSLGLGFFLMGCGQKGNLYLPTEAASAGRASLPGSVGNTASQSAQNVLRVLTPSSGASSPLKPDTTVDVKPGKEELRDDMQTPTTPAPRLP